MANINFQALKGKNEKQALKWFRENGMNEAPDWWFDPIKRMEMLGQDLNGFTADSIIDGHLSQFDLAYGDEDHLGSRARAVGDLRNVDGQGLCGEEAWRKQIREGGGNHGGSRK